MQRISVNLTNDCGGNQLNYNNDLPAIGNKNYALEKPFKQIFWHKNRHRETATVICRSLGGPRHPILLSNIFFYVKLFATSILSWNLLKYVLWYLLELADPFFLNENSVFPILIEKGNPIFSIKLG